MRVIGLQPREGAGRIALSWPDQYTKKKASQRCGAGGISRKTLMASSACGNITGATASFTHRRVGCYHYCLMLSGNQTEFHRCRPFIRGVTIRNRESSPSSGAMASEPHAVCSHRCRFPLRNPRAPRGGRRLTVPWARGGAAQQSSLYNSRGKQARARAQPRLARARLQPEFVVAWGALSPAAPIPFFATP